MTKAEACGLLLFSSLASLAIHCGSNGDANKSNGVADGGSEGGALDAAAHDGQTTPDGAVATEGGGSMDGGMDAPPMVFVPGHTWYVRPDGGTRYSTNVATANATAPPTRRIRGVA